MFHKMSLVAYSFLLATQTMASGWVKSPGAYYAKVEYASSQSSFEPLGAFGFEQIQKTLSLYGEYGLDHPRPLQISIYVPYLQIEREGTLIKDQFTTGAFGDSFLQVKHAAYQLMGYSSYGLNLLSALQLGLVIPTTSEKFRTGNEHDRSENVPEDRTFLIPPAGDGIVKLSAGAGFTINHNALWLNLKYQSTFTTDQKKADTLIASDVGIGLPMNSWLQASWQQLSKDAYLEGIAPTSSSKVTASGGWTFYRNHALEAAYSKPLEEEAGWKKAQSYSLGYSNRSL